MNGYAPLFQLNFTFDKSEMSQKENILKAEEHSVPSFTFGSVVAVLRVTSVCRSVVNLHLIPIFCDIFFSMLTWLGRIYNNLPFDSKDM